MKLIHYGRSNQSGEQKVQTNWLKAAPLLAAGATVLFFGCSTANTDGPVCKNPPTAPPAKVAKAEPKERVRVAVCTTGCSTDEKFNETMFLSHAYEVDSSSGSNYRTKFYVDDKKKEILMEGIGNDKVRYFRRTINGETVVQETRKNAGFWGPVTDYKGKEAQEVWEAAVLTYALASSPLQ